MSDNQTPQETQREIDRKVLLSIIDKSHPMFASLEMSSILDVYVKRYQDGHDKELFDLTYQASKVWADAFAAAF
ncbi:MAG: hypothetical protein Q4E62_07820 [Sutterellaceae bacterium]|nr:hypothetical protein [Sutterellaceae bacterium]